MRGGSRCSLHPYDKSKRGKTQRTWQKLYNRAAWRKLRKMHLARQPMCQACQARGKITPGKVVDHIEPHRGELSLFLNAANLQTLCPSCHSRKTASTDGAFGNPSRPGGR
ncbi:MAG: HNH endonuclease, partial [Pontiella sp.]|nr:HNH endonuclease [Pontiella sp.]